MPYYIKRWPKKAKKETKEVAGYLLDDIKGGKNYFLMGNKIQIENDFLFFEIKCIVYDFYFE